MELEEFLQKNRIFLSDKVFSLCGQGIEIMRESVDPLHDKKHLFRIFGDLGCFLERNLQVKKSDLDFEVLLLSICWHDVWKSTRFPTNRISVVFDQVWEGVGSMRLFAKRAGEVKLEPKLTHLVEYSIRKHSRFQIFPARTTESRILKDLDGLDEWSLVKLESLKKRYLAPGNIDPKLLRLAKFWFDHFMARITGSAFYLEWSKTEFVKRKKAYFEETDKLLQKYKRLL